MVSNEFGTPGERSRVYVAFDDDNLYFAARFFDSRPGTIVAKVLSKRDVSFGEDGFSVTLDPYDQARAGYIFDVNPNGMRSEAIYTDKDRQNWDWEGIWDAAARIDGEGWTAEVAIPLKTLSFDPARDAWGLNFTRWHGVDSEQFGWMSYNRTQDLSRTGLVTGLAGLNQGRGLDIVPGLRTGATRNHEHGRGGRLPRALARRVLEDHALAHRGRDSQPGFLRHDGGHAADQPDPLRPVLSRATGILPPGLGHLPVRGAGGAERNPVLLAPHRARRRGRGAHARCRPQARRTRGTAQRRRAGRAPGRGRRSGIRGSLRRPRRGERPRGVERRRHRHERQSRPERRQQPRRRRFPLPQHAHRRGPHHRGDGLVPADRHRRTRGRRYRLRIQLRDAEQRGLERRDRPQGPRGELLPGARVRGAHGLRGDFRRARLHLAPGEQLGPQRRDRDRRRVRRADQWQRPQPRDRVPAVRGGEPGGGPAGARVPVRRGGVRGVLRDLGRRRDSRRGPTTSIMPA